MALGVLVREAQNSDADLARTSNDKTVGWNHDVQTRWKASEAWTKHEAAILTDKCAAAVSLKLRCFSRRRSIPTGDERRGDYGCEHAVNLQANSRRLRC